MRVGRTVRGTCASALALLLGACAIGPTTPQPRNGGTLYLALDSMPQSLNPLVARDAVSERAYTPLFPLLYSAQADLSVSPELAAASPSFGEGGRTITVALRSDARWSDGTPITAADVVYTVTAEMNPALQTTATFDWSPLISVTAVDAHTVRFSLSRPDAAFIADDLVTPIVPQHVLKSTALSSMATAAFSSAPTVSGGPFVYASRTTTTITLDANPTFFLGRPHADHVVERVVTDPNSAPSLLGEGTLSFDPSLTPAAASQAIISSGVTVESYADTSFVAVLFNMAAGRPFAAQSVRQAFADSIDHDDLVSHVTGIANDIPVWGDINPASWAFSQQAAKQYQQNAAAARGLLQGASPTAQLLVPQSNPLLQTAATTLRQQADAAGFALSLNIAGVQDYATDLQRGDFDLAIINISTGLDPDPAQLYLPGSAGNFGGYNDPAVTALITQEQTATAASLTALRQARAPLFARIEQLVTSDLPMYFLWAPRHSVGFGATVAGFAGAGVQLDADRANTFYLDWFLTQ